MHSLQQKTQCHVVAASPPTLEGQQMRVSTTLIERKLMQSLSTLQGQLFIMLKYLIKRVIAKRVKGLKTYHAKNLLFYMLDKTPADDWQPHNLIKLLRQSLQLLLDSLTDAGSSEHQCMWHFFMRDAAVYLRKDHQRKCDIALVIREVLNELPELLAQFQQTLMKNSPSLIEFHPFLVLPIINDLPVSESDTELEYHEIYDVVKQVLAMLSKQVSASCEARLLQQLDRHIQRIPDCATTARECLRALMQLRRGESLSDCMVTSLRSSGKSLSKGIPCPNSEGVAKISHGTAHDTGTIWKDLVWQRLLATDSAWKFMFYFDQKPHLEFLPDHISMAFPWQLPNRSDLSVYINFYALTKSLQLEARKLAGHSISSADLLQDFSDVFAGSADPQELLMVLHYCCGDEDLLVQAIHCNRDMISATGLSGFVLRFIESRASLSHKCVHATWQKVEDTVSQRTQHTSWREHLQPAVNLVVETVKEFIWERHPK